MFSSRMFPGGVRPERPASVTRVSERERPALAGGLEARDIDVIWSRIERWYESGMSPAIALCLRRRGETVIDRSIGMARLAEGSRGGEVATPDHLFHLFSASKIVVAVLVHMACGRGLVELDAPVASYVPEFAEGGKGQITVADVLAHRAGLPRLREPTTLELLNDRPRIIRWLCQAKPLVRPGRLAYHALTGGYILAEVLERVHRAPLDDILRREVAEPLGLSYFRYGATPDQHPRVAHNVFTGLPLVPPLSLVVRRALGISAEDATRLSNHQRYCDAIIPAANLVTAPDQACRFMEALRLTAAGDADPLPGLTQMGLRRALEPQSAHLELDHTLMLPVRYGLGFQLGARAMSPYGFNTIGAFGHLGFMQVLLWADPRREVAGALVTTGKTFLSPGLFHFAAVMQTIARRCR